MRRQIHLQKASKIETVYVDFYHPVVDDIYKFFTKADKMQRLGLSFVKREIKIMKKEDDDYETTTWPRSYR